MCVWFGDGPGYILTLRCTQGWCCVSGYKHIFCWSHHHTILMEMTIYIMGTYMLITHLYMYVYTKNYFIYLINLVKG